MREAERLTSPADNPARFGQVADRFADLWQTLEDSPDPDHHPSRNPALAREAAFLAATRANLPRIAIGDRR